MNIYDFQTIKDSVTIPRYLQDRGIMVKSNRFPAAWRDSQDLNCSISTDGKTWCDHANGHTGGSILDLCMVAEHIPSPLFAAQTLGDRYHLTIKSASKIILPADGTPITRYMELRSQGWQHTATYTYTDEEGTALYSVLRLHNPETGAKTFLQRAAGHWGIENIRRVLYNLPALIKATTVYIVEGEKDADTLIHLGITATTNSGGAKNWEQDFNRFFQGKNVIILQDNDTPGYEHAKEVIRQINDIAASIKLICPSNNPKGDVTDYLQKEGGTLQSLLARIDQTAFHDRKTASAQNALYTIETARELNTTPFRNFIETQETDTRGNPKTIERPVHVNPLIAECRRRFLDFPRRLGSILFDRDLKTGSITWLHTTDALISWIAVKSKQPVEWSKARGAVSQNQFFQAALLTVRAYQGVAKAPHFPLRPEIFYINKPLPQIDPAAPSKLDTLIDRFTPATPAYRTLIKTLVMAPIYFCPTSPRPAWVIDSVDGKGVGKTTLVKLIAELYDESPIDLDTAAIKADLTSIIKRLVSSEGRSRRIALLDNVQGNLRSPNLARLITATTLSGIAPYGLGEETRANDITYIITSNAASLDDDIAKRAYTVKLARSKRLPSWETDTLAFIRSHRETIFAEIIATLAHPHVTIQTAVTRYPEFERDVLCAACQNDKEYTDAIKAIISDGEESNTTNDRAQEIVDVFAEVIAATLRGQPGASPKYPTFLNTAAISNIIINSDTLRIEHIGKSEILEMIQSGNTAAFSRKVRVIRIDSTTFIRGILWIQDTTVNLSSAPTYVNIIEVEKDTLVFRTCKSYIFNEI